MKLLPLIMPCWRRRTERHVCYFLFIYICFIFFLLIFLYTNPEIIQAYAQIPKEEGKKKKKKTRPQPPWHGTAPQTGFHPARRGSHHPSSADPFSIT